MRERLRESGQALSAVVANRQLLRVEIARGTIAIGLGVYGIVFIILAYRAGGIAAVGVLSVVRLLTTATAAPFGALLGDRFPRPRVMYLADLFRAAVVGVAAVAAASDPPALLVFVLGALTAVAGTASAPARAALIPALVRSPDQLAAANVVGTTSEGIAALAGPALGGLLLAWAGTEAALLVAAAACLVSALLVSGIRVPGDADIAVRPRTSLWRAASGGFHLLAATPGIRSLAGLYIVQNLATGMLATLLVVAVIELLDLGESGVGYASAVMSIGGLVGAAATLVVVGGQGLWRGVVGGTILWSLAVVLLAAWQEPVFAFLLFGVIGLADAVVKTSGITLFQQAVPDEVLARAFGALAAVLFTVAALGALVAPALDELLGTKGALLVTGAVLFPAALVTMPALRALEPRTAHEALAALRRVEFLSVLPADVLEPLAGRAEHVSVAAGERVFSQGDEGDRFYVVVAGSASIAVDEQEAAVAGPGDFFGEIALIRDVPRTATVTAREALELWAIHRDDFLNAVSDDPASLDAAGAVVTGRLGRAVPLDLA